ncbi:MAG: efflux RND transporter periplasmic adaptor subunit, partial [Muribaculaceae bacterium]|nr:efflux RND transporter periplasmic adaptor subunit [Muribaculaceae bacterium]
MDRDIPQSQRRRRRMLRILPWVAGGVLLIGGLIGLSVWLERGVQERDLTFSTAETGTIESAVTSTGRITPAYEEIIVSPVSTR